MDARDIPALAALHVGSIPDSLIAVLGERYVRTFYHYVARSSSESVVVDRDAAGIIVAAAVISMEPDTLNTRLLRHTGLLSAVVRRAPYVLSMLWQSARRPRGVPPAQHDAKEPAGAPELVLMFTAPGMRSRGRGAALLRQVDGMLRQRGVGVYVVRTISDPANRALAFYRANGFVPSGMSYRLGTAFQIFTRTLAD